jgi:hypothetical protein
MQGFTKANQYVDIDESVWTLTPGQVPEILQLCTSGAMQQNLEAVRCRGGGCCKIEG